MAQATNDNFQFNTPKDPDNRRGRFTGGVWRLFTSAAEALSTVPQAYRYRGLSLFIAPDTATDPVEWWFKNGVTDAHFVVKATGGGDSFDHSTLVSAADLYENSIVKRTKLPQVHFPQFNEATETIDGIAAPTLRIPLKTINGNSLEGTGDIAIDGSGNPTDLSGYVAKTELYENEQVKRTRLPQVHFPQFRETTEAIDGVTGPTLRLPLKTVGGQPVLVQLDENGNPTGPTDIPIGLTEAQGDTRYVLKGETAEVPPPPPETEEQAGVYWAKVPSVSVREQKAVLGDSIVVKDTVETALPSVELPFDSISEGQQYFAALVLDFQNTPFYKLKSGGIVLESETAVTPDISETTEKFVRYFLVKGGSIYEGDVDLSNYYNMQQVDQMFAALPSNIGNYRTVTHARLLELITASALIPATFYRISDFQTIHSITNSNGFGGIANMALNVHGTVYENNVKASWAKDNSEGVEPIFIQAITATEMGNTAYSQLYPTDRIEYNPLDVLCEDGLTPRKGKITLRRDTITGNEAPYDFRKVRHRRFHHTILNWSAGSVYAKHRAIKGSDGNIYVSKTAGNANNNPVVNSAGSDVKTAYHNEFWSIFHIAELTTPFFVYKVTDLAYNLLGNSQIGGDTASFIDFYTFNTMSNGVWQLGNIGKIRDCVIRPSINSPYANNVIAPTNDGVNTNNIECQVDSHDNFLTGENLYYTIIGKAGRGNLITNSWANTLGFTAGQNVMVNNLQYTSIGAHSWGNVFGPNSKDNVIGQRARYSYFGSRLFRNTFAENFENSIVKDNFYENIVNERVLNRTIAHPWITFAAGVQPTLRSGTVIRFDVIDPTYGAGNSESGNITVDLLNAIPGVVALLIHNAPSEPSFASPLVKKGGTYKPGEKNYIYIQYLTATDIIYTIL